MTSAQSKVVRGGEADIHILAKRAEALSLEVYSYWEELGSAESMRAMIHLLRSPSLSGAQQQFIFGAVYFTEAAQNILLKSLEEPCEGTSIVLVVDKPLSLAPTILSRAPLDTHYVPVETTNPLEKMSVSESLVYIGKIKDGATSRSEAYSILSNLQHKAHTLPLRLRAQLTRAVVHAQTFAQPVVLKHSLEMAVLVSPSSVK
jgi:DNA polymerase III, delta subunit